MADLKIVKANVGEAPEVVTIPHSLDDMYKVVGGWIETVRISEDILLIIDEEGLLKEKPLNFTIAVVEGIKVIQGHHIVGNCFFVAYEGEEFTSLNEEQIQRVLKFFNADRQICLVR